MNAALLVLGIICLLLAILVLGGLTFCQIAVAYKVLEMHEQEKLLYTDLDEMAEDVKDLPN